MKTDLFQSCDHCWVFQICWHIECNTFTESSFRIWNSSTGIPSEHCISCCPSHQLPWVPGAARTPATQAAEPPPHLALTGANLSPPGQPREQTPVGDPHAEVEIRIIRINKNKLKSRDSVAKEEHQKPSHHLYRLQIKSTRSTRQTLSLEYTKGYWELPPNKTH